MSLSKAQRKKVQKWIEEAQIKLLLNNWNIRVFYDEKDVDGMMEVRCDLSYLNASVLVDQTRLGNEWKEFGDDVIRKHCFHEVVHVLLKRYDMIAKSRNLDPEQWSEVAESTTSQITKILV